MLSLDPNFKELLKSLNSAGARFLVIGGYAVNFHGYHRNTADIDLWIALDPDNAKKVSHGLQQFGFPPESVPAADFQRKGQILRFGRPPLRVDILTDPSGIDFEQCYARKVIAELDGVSVPFISLEDLKTNKRAAARTKDVADVENLR
jgi:predicted nucleotidyltransferase